MSALTLAALVLAAPPADPFAVTVAGGGPPVVFVPGLGCSGKVWDETAAHFKGAHECHVLTLAGFDGVPPLQPDAPFIDSVAAGIVRYVREKKLAKPVVVGHSLGAAVALRVGIVGGADIGAVVAVDGFPCNSALVRPGITADQLKQAGDAERTRFAGLTREQQFADLKAMFGPWLIGDRLATATGWLAESDPATLARSKGEVRATDLRADLGRIVGPVRVLAAYDPAYETKYGLTAELMKARLTAQLAAAKRATVTVKTGPKHFIMYDDPAWLHEEIGRALGEK